MVAEMGPDDDQTPPTENAVLADFTDLKQDVGLTPEKMRSARAIMAALGEMHPVLATQRLLDDLGDMEDDDGVALAWALRAEPEMHPPLKLDDRRKASRVPENTAKDRERRAAKRLYQKWISEREDWATAVYAMGCKALPVRSEVQLGSLRVSITVRHDESRDIPVVSLMTKNRLGPYDQLMVAADAERAMVVYATGDRRWRIEMHLPRFERETLLIHREHGETPPNCLVIEMTEADGRASYSETPGDLIPERTLFELPVATLDPPCPITWWWVPPPKERRPIITFPEDEL